MADNFENVLKIQNKNEPEKPKDASIEDINRVQAELHRVTIDATNRKRDGEGIQQEVPKLESTGGKSSEQTTETEKAREGEKTPAQTLTTNTSESFQSRTQTTQTETPNPTGRKPMTDTEIAEYYKQQEAAGNMEYVGPNGTTYKSKEAAERAIQEARSMSMNDVRGTLQQLVGGEMTYEALPAELTSKLESSLRALKGMEKLSSLAKGDEAIQKLVTTLREIKRGKYTRTRLAAEVGDPSKTEEVEARSSGLKPDTASSIDKLLEFLTFDAEFLADEKLTDESEKFTPKTGESDAGIKVPEDASLAEINKMLHEVTAFRISADIVQNTELSESQNEPINASVSERPWEYTDDVWRAELQKIPDFKGNIENAVRLLDQFSQGMARVTAEVAKDKTRNFQSPDLLIYFGKNVEKTGIHYDPKRNVMVIGRDRLANLSNFNPEEFIQLNADLPGKQPVFVGRIGDFARLAGVEEVQHAERSQRGGKMESNVGTYHQLTKLSEYDSSDAEYEALQWQLRDAQQQKMPRETVRNLEWRINQAQRVRRQKGSGI